MSTPIDKLKALAAKGWSSDVVKEMKEVLKAAEIHYSLPFEAYITDLAPIRFLLHYSDFEEPMVRLLWHRYHTMKLKGTNIEGTLKTAAEFSQLLTDLNYEGISKLMDKSLQAFSADLPEVADVILRNYRENLWNFISLSFEEISKKELLAIFAIASLDVFAREGFKLNLQGEYVRLEALTKPKQTQKECEMQMRILEKAVSRIESIQT